jgi:signal transduction histidine kinase
MMLAITPQSTQLQELVDSTLKMFESELQEKKITATASTESPMKANNTDWVSCDPFRLTQIIVNFLTNAIKFTKDESRREIKIHYGTATSEPRSAFPNDINWAPINSTSPSPKLSSERNPFQLLYLTFAVEDSGAGMDSVDMQDLFSRFTQANIKTSIKYGALTLAYSSAKDSLRRWEVKSVLFRQKEKVARSSFILKRAKLPQKKLRVHPRTR